MNLLKTICLFCFFMSTFIGESSTIFFSLTPWARWFLSMGDNWWCEMCMGSMLSWNNKQNYMVAYEDSINKWICFLLLACFVVTNLIISLVPSTLNLNWCVGSAHNYEWLLLGVSRFIIFCSMQLTCSNSGVGHFFNATFRFMQNVKWIQKIQRGLSSQI